MTLTRPVDEHDHARGSEDAPVTMVEYGDYECPHCGRAHPIIEQLLDRVGDRVRFVFRNFPLTQAHPHAQQAAEAAEAAAAQGQFWPMHSWIFEHQDTLGDDALIAAARSLGLDADRVGRELTEHTYADRVRTDFMGGVRAGVNGTPTFFLNGTRHDGPWDLDSLLAAVERAG